MLHCKLSHDAKYLKSIPQTCNYLVRLKSYIALDAGFKFWKLSDLLQSVLYDFKNCVMWMPGEFVYNKAFVWLDKQTKKQNTTLDKIRLFLNIRSPKIFISPINLSYYGIHVNSLWETTKDGTLCAEGLTKKFPPVMQILDLEIFFSVLFQRDIRNKQTYKMNHYHAVQVDVSDPCLLCCCLLARLPASASYGVNTSLLGTGVKLPFLIGTLNNLWWIAMYAHYRSRKN